jgi:hypothetical protein
LKCLRHEEKEDEKSHRGDGGQKQEASLVANMAGLPAPWVS